VGTELAGPGPAAGEAVFGAPAVEVNGPGPAVGARVLAGVQCAVMAPPGTVAPLGVVVAVVVPECVAPAGRLPLPAGEPPPPPGWPDVGPPVSTVELTCTMACRNGGTANAMLAMNAMPASTPTGRSQAMPVGQLAFEGVAACRGGGEWVTAGNSRNRSRGRAVGRGNDCGHSQAQWPRQTQCLA
jgi:hypothetical protein